jgi:ABC-type uncharacterized transport system permease subunit
VSTTARKTRRLRARVKQRVQDEALSRFGWLVGGVLVFELLVFVFVLAQNGIFVRPLG